jgi:hypothetical protein
MDAFWNVAKKIAGHALSVSNCRKKKLLIYFATDDPLTLRPLAVEHLSVFGQVVFGLDLHEVGHSSPQVSKKKRNLRTVILTMNDFLPQWSDREKEYVRRAHTNATYAAEIKRATNKLYQVIAVPPLSDSETENHGTMSLVEWWVISQANWLFANGMSEYSYTAAGLGLSPRGAMEKYSCFTSDDAVDPHVLFRRDWANDPCKSISAEDVDTSKNCPNE